MMPVSLQMTMPLNLMAYYGSFAIVVTLLLRLLLKRLLPKAVFPVIWTLVMVRLIVPFSISSPISLCAPIFPTLKPPATLKISNSASPNTMTMVPTQTIPQMDWSVVVSVLFCIGVMWTLVVLLLQKRHYDKKLQDCLPLTENKAANDALRALGMEKIPVFTCDNITTPLVRGLLRPRIFMPTEMDFTESKLVQQDMPHELVHIQLGHNWVKAAMLVALCLNWYNPLAWVMAHCMGADLESACDAAVMKRTHGNERHDYAKSLLAMSMTEKRPALLYSSFAKTEVEQRIKGVLCYRRTTALTLGMSALVLGASAVAVATVGQAEFSPVLTSSHKTISGRWLLRGDMTWNVPLGEHPQSRADSIIERLLAQDTTDDIDQLEKQLQVALSAEFGVPKASFTLSAQRTGTDEDFNAEYAASGMTQNERGRYLYEGELVRMLDDQVRGFGATNPLGTVDVEIRRDRQGRIAELSAHREGDTRYDKRTKDFPT